MIIAWLCTLLPDTPPTCPQYINTTEVYLKNKIFTDNVENDIILILSEPEIFNIFFLLYLLYMRDCKQTLHDDAMSEVIWDTGQLDCPRLFQRKCWKLDLVFILKSAVSPLTGRWQLQKHLSFCSWSNHLVAGYSCCLDKYYSSVL